MTLAQLFEYYEPVNDAIGSKNLPSARPKLEQRLVFISHASSDHKLAMQLRSLIDKAFSNVVLPFVSSDRGPAGGLMPGEEWYNEIHARLRAAEAVWVLATPTSLARPWIYWEAGIGKAICPGAVVVVRVDLKPGDIPSPLNSFQSFDGNSKDGMTELLGKVATQIGMSISPVLLDSVTTEWMTFTGDYKPDPPSTGEPNVSPEQLDDFQIAVGRLEGAIAVLQTVPAVQRPRRRTPRASSEENDPDDERHVLARRSQLFGNLASVYTNVSDFVSALMRVPNDVPLEFLEMDNEGDATVIAGKTGSETDLTAIWLASSAIPSISSFAKKGVSKRVLDIVHEIAEEAG